MDYEKVVLTHEVKRITAGQYFGELALIYDSPRTATVQAVKKCHLAVLTKEDYDEILADEDVKDLESFIVTLRQCPMFAHWTKMSLCKMSYYFKTVDYLRNHIVFNEGDIAVDVFIVVHGNFTLTKKVKGKRL